MTVGTRRRDALACAALTVLAFLQSPGQMVADTKTDLFINPVQWLQRSLHLWDPSGSFGQVQNQAYGYLWPMGPFFAAGTGVGLPPWAVQRLWWALLFCVAYLGVVRLAERLAIGSPISRLIGGIAFALSPRILTQLGAVSVETWPSAIAPWVVVPLVGLAAGGSIRRAVVWSALAVACAGGVNATAVFATAPLAFLFLCTITPVRRRLAAIAAWSAAVLAATAWWIVPLLVLGRYSPPFLDYIESAATTTWATDPVTVLRGASYWPAWLDQPYIQMPAGYAIARTLVPAVASMLLVAFGLAGLARRGMPHRRVLVAALVVGFTLVSLGHQGGLAGTFGEALRAFLDGSGAPLRNVHKFDVLVRLPLVLGMTHFVGIVLRARVGGPGRVRGRVPGLAAAAAAVAAILGVASPALAGGLAAPRGFTQVPDYWRSAAAWLNERSDEGRVLVIPGVHFPRYTWGDTLEELTQPLLHGPTAVRNVIPLSPPSTIRMMDAVEQVLATGSGSPGLAQYLARAGISYVLVRNDLDYGRSVTTSPLLVAQALDRTPGLSEVGTFGPDIVSPSPAGSRDELAVAVPALRILRVSGAVDRAVTYPADQAATVVGGPESMLWLAEAGLLPVGPVVLAGDVTAAEGLPGVGSGPVIITDGLRLRDRSYGGGREPVSQTLTVEQARGAKDLLPVWGRQWTVPAALLGIEDVRASTSRSDKNSSSDSQPGFQPFAALDGDLSTSWRPAPDTAKRKQWIEVVLSEPKLVPQVTIHYADPSLTLGRVARATVVTEAGTAAADVDGTTAVVNLGATVPVQHIRIGVEIFEEIVKDGSFGIAEIDIPGVTAQRTLVVPAPPAGTSPATVVLTAAPETPACFFVDTPADPPVRCAGWVARASEDGPVLDRTLTLTVPSDYTATVWAQPRAGAALNALLDGLVAAGPTVTASSSSFDEPAARPGVVVDNDSRTTWRAAAFDPAPELRFTWPEPQVLSGVRLSLESSSIAALGTPAGDVSVVAGGQKFDGVLTAGTGEVRFSAPVRTSEVTVRLRPGEPARPFNPYSEKVETPLPVAVSEVTFLGAPMTGRTEPADPDAMLDLPCGSGPTLVVGDQTTSTRLSATPRDLLERRTVPAVACEGQAQVSLPSGTARVVARASDIARATRVALVPTQAASTAGTAPASVHTDQWSATHRLVTIGEHSEDLVFAVRENTNPGWTATLHGVQLSPLVVDGWQQGWLVPGGLSGQIELRFAPDTLYRTALLSGAALVLGLLVLGLVPRRKPERLAPRPRPAGTMLLLVTGIVAFVVTAGVLGGVIALVGLAVVTYARTRSGRRPALLTRTRGWLAVLDQRYPWAKVRLWAALVPWLLPAALLMLAGAAWVVAEEGNYHWIPQTLGILAVGYLWVWTQATSPRTAS